MDFYLRSLSPNMFITILAIRPPIGAKPGLFLVPKVPTDDGSTHRYYPARIHLWLPLNRPVFIEHDFAVDFCSPGTSIAIALICPSSLERTLSLLWAISSLCSFTALLQYLLLLGTIIGPFPAADVQGFARIKAPYHRVNTAISTNIPMAKRT